MHRIIFTLVFICSSINTLYGCQKAVQKARQVADWAKSFVVADVISHGYNQDTHILTLINKRTGQVKEVQDVSMDDGFFCIPIYKNDMQDGSAKVSCKLFYHLYTDTLVCNTPVFAGASGQRCHLWTWRHIYKLMHVAGNQYRLCFIRTERLAPY